MNPQFDAPNLILNIINTVMNVVICSSIIIAIWQLNIMKKTTSQDHERSRREKAIDLILEWVKFTNDGTGAKCLVERLDEKQCEKVWKEQAFEMEIKYKDYAERNIKGFGNVETDETRKVVIISKSQSSILRKEVVSYLNLTEVVFAAMYNSVADRDIILNEFSSLVCDRQNIHYLEKFRKVAGAKSAFPYSYRFVDELVCPIAEKEPLGK